MDGQHQDIYEASHEQPKTEIEILLAESRKMKIAVEIVKELVRKSRLVSYY